MTKKLGFALLIATAVGCGSEPRDDLSVQGASSTVRTAGEGAAFRELTDAEIPQTEKEWRARLTPEQYYVAREKGTERPYQNDYWDCKKDGVYRCRCCGKPLFSSAAKYDSGTGWPSYWQPIAADNVATESDNTSIFPRTEVHCSRCQAHLGHVFEDGPDPTGLRYCMNSAALYLDEKPRVTPASNGQRRTDSAD